MTKTFNNFEDLAKYLKEKKEEKENDKKKDE